MKRFLAFLGIVGFAVLLSVPADAAYNPPTQSATRGQTICGGTDLKTGKSLQPCGYASATKQSNARKQCPNGAFFDLGSWSCYTCPMGFNRSGNEITGDAACSKEVPKQFIRAKFLQKYNSCPSGSVFDPRNGGECWQCPSGFGRTAASVSEWNACGKAFAKARSAELVATVCPRDTFPDGRNGGECWTCPAGYLRSSLPVQSANACYRTEALSKAERSQESICRKGELFDPIDGGTCWTCPENSIRSVFGVKSREACERAEIEWAPVTRDSKSLYHIPGGAAVTAAVIEARTGIEKIVRENAREAKANADENLAQEWELIATAPQESGVLIGAVFARVLEIIKDGAKTKDERDLLAYFAQYVQDSRYLYAVQMKDIYESWQGNNVERMQRSGSKVTTIYSLGVKPPDLNKVVGNVMAMSGGGMMIGGYAMLAFKPSAAAFKGTVLEGFAKNIFPNMLKHMVKKTAEESVKKAATTLAGPITGQAASLMAGPLLILTGACIVGELGIEIIVENEKAQAKIEDALAIAEKPVDLKRLLLSEKGEGELLTNWMVMTQETKAPPKPFGLPKIAVTENRSVSVNVVNAGTPSAESGVTVTEQKITTQPTPLPSDKWEHIDGEANDIAIASDGTAYIVSTGKKKGGFAIYRRAKKANKWAIMPGAATRIAVEGKTPWAVDDSGRVFTFNGRAWAPDLLAPKANDIGASSGGKGVWLTGLDGQIYQRDLVGWKKTSGRAVRVDVDRNGTAWVITDKDEIYTRQGDRWNRVNGIASDVAIDVPGVVNVVGTNGIVYGMKSGRWEALSANGIVSALGVGDGEIWATGTNQLIYKMK